MYRTGIAFLIGFAVAAVIHTGTKDKPKPTEPAVPSEISVTVPDGAGGHTDVRFTVEPVTYAETDVQPPLGPTDSVVMFHYPQLGTGNYKATCYRGRPVTPSR
jgi:hypothetical protein